MTPEQLANIERLVDHALHAARAAHALRNRIDSDNCQPTRDQAADARSALLAAIHAIAAPAPVQAAPTEAERDAARLNWMEANWAAWCGSEHPGMYFGTDWAHRGWIAEKSLRAAIDAAMQAAQGLETKP